MGNTCNCKKTPDEDDASKKLIENSSQKILKFLLGKSLQLKQSNISKIINEKITLASSEYFRYDIKSTNPPELNKLKEDFFEMKNFADKITKLINFDFYEIFNGLTRLNFCIFENSKEVLQKIYEEKIQKNNSWKNDLERIQFESGINEDEKIELLVNFEPNYLGCKNVLNFSDENNNNSKFRRVLDRILTRIINNEGKFTESKDTFVNIEHKKTKEIRKILLEKVYSNTGYETKLQPTNYEESKTKYLIRNTFRTNKNFKFLEKINEIETKCFTTRNKLKDSENFSEQNSSTEVSNIDKSNLRRAKIKGFLEKNSNLGTIIPRTIEITGKNKDYLYMGSYDRFNLLWSNYGILVKPNLSIYQGEFKNGIRCGVGGFFSLESNDYHYYLGEWNHDKPEGFGILFTYNKEVGKLNLKRGHFSKGDFIKGTSISIKVSKTTILFNKYEGRMAHNKFFSGASITKFIYKFDNRNINSNLEVESEYYYRGDFRLNLEEGNGICVKKCNSNNYNYIYKGEFMKGEMNGQGKILFEGNYYIKKYEGFFENGKWLVKYGRIYFQSGDYYEGFFDPISQKYEIGLYRFTKNEIPLNNSKDHLKNPLKFIKNDEEFEKLDCEFSNLNCSDIFFGEYHGDMKNGYGKYYFLANKSLLLGNYYDGMRNGKFESVNLIITNGIQPRKKSFIKRPVPLYNIQKVKKYFLFDQNEKIEESDQPI